MITFSVAHLVRLRMKLPIYNNGTLCSKVVVLHYQHIKQQIPVTDLFFTASCLLGVETSDLKECLTSSSMVTRGETIARHSSPAEAAVARDATARGLYARTFDRIVERINALLCHNKSQRLVAKLIF